jgi:hypothetical protein
VKRSPEEALLASILDGLDCDVEDLAEHVAEQLAAYRKHIAASGQKIAKGLNGRPTFADALRSIEGGVVDLQAYRTHTAPTGQNITKGRQTMDGSFFRKLLIEVGPIPSTRKSVYYNAIKALGDELRQAGDSDAKAFSRAMDDPEGVQLSALMKRATGREVELVDKDYGSTQRAAPAGPVALEAKERADALRRANPKLTDQQAYARAITSDPSLLTRVLAEERNARTPPGRSVNVETARAANHEMMVRTS